MKKWMISLLSVLALALAFSGCGGSEGSSTGNSSEPISVAPDTSVEEESSPVYDLSANTAADSDAITADDALGNIVDKYGSFPGIPGV